MLEATYKDTKYTFNITTKDVSVLNPPFSAFLFKFTNDMSGDVKWAYGQNTVIRNRYTTVDFFHDTTESVFDGKVNFNPQGYWKYDVYEIPFSTTPVLDDCNAVNPSLTNWDVNDTSGTLDSGTFDLYDYKLSNCTSALSPYSFNLYPDCTPTGGSETATVVYKTQEVNPERLIHVDTITQTPTGIIVTMSSIVPTTRYTIEFGSSIVVTIGAQQNLTVFLPDVSTDLSGTSYTFKLYEGVQLKDIYNNITSATNPSGVTNNATVMFINNEYETGWGGGTDLGSIFFTAQYLLFPILPYVPPSGTTLEDLKIEVGKLLINEQEGAEQVQYNQHSTTDTNYIYND